MISREKNNFWIPAEWPVPGHVHAGTTTRQTGCSIPPFDGFNLAFHVGDNKEFVKKNRNQLKTILKLPSDPVWLNQVHGHKAIKAQTQFLSNTADAIYTDNTDIVCAVLTADCVPLLICNKTGSEIAAIHAGWRGLCSNIIENTLKHFNSNIDDLIAWLGPHISADCYEVGNDVRDASIDSLVEMVTEVFIINRGHHWQADLGKMTRLLLLKQGVTKIYSNNQCTYQNGEYYYSYRREGETGRMASLIWIEHNSIN